MSEISSIRLKFEKDTKAEQTSRMPIQFRRIKLGVFRLIQKTFRQEANCGEVLKFGEFSNLL
jgi:hypothetical protein